MPCNPAHVSPHHPKLVKVYPQNPNNKSYLCLTCDQLFKDIEGANYHIFNSVGIFKCPLCQIAPFTSAKALNEHLKLGHNILLDKRHRTAINPPSVISNTQSNIHQVFPAIMKENGHVSRMNEYNCSCGKTFSDAHNAKLHVIHEAYIHCCGICCKLFKRSTDAAKHCTSAETSLYTP
ncbi:hypothetical protein M422DRAFT_31639 [Sphaerobolus stellatus SS14]|uniref:C2H2-type domain-containing protein n=1 Tax=Sphaerobolus stellatus (strain SS14) TaxID=990650 RepID=A0A0C9UFV1_SPHS4|nr:hypothetical protein M422DRAFT_31639 [Sphaerobolus stellatus SS14]